MSDTPVDKFRLLAELGHGGMADVYLAVLRGMQDFKKLAVIKRLRGHLAEDPDFLAMFLQEARIAARLNHPNVVHTFEVGYDGKHHFMAMEYLEGHPYSALLVRAGRDKLDLRIQLKILIDALEGLHYAHALADFDGKPMGLVHRDVSPQNIFVTYDGQVKLLDFGIAKALDSAIETRSGVVKGKLSYMSPEQALANPIDRRADLYSIGVLLWEAVGQGRRWKGLTDVQLIKAIVNNHEVKLPPMEGRKLPPSLPAMLKRALAYSPDDRYATALDFQAEMEKLLEELGPRVSNRDVGKLLSGLFEADRARLGSTIEKELKKIDRSDADRANTASGLARISLPNSSFTPTMESAYAASSPSSSSGGQTSGASSGVPSVAISETRGVSRTPRRSNNIIWILAFAAALTAIALFVRSRQLARTPSAAPALNPMIASSENATVQVRILARPPVSELFVDGERVSNPYTSTLPKNRGRVSLRTESPGYETDARLVSLGEDVNLEISLSPSRPSALAPERARRAPQHARIAAPHGGLVPTPEPPPPASASEPTTQVPAKKEKSGRVLDSDNPWK